MRHPFRPIVVHLFFEREDTEDTEIDVTASVVLAEREEEAEITDAVIVGTTTPVTLTPHEVAHLERRALEEASEADREARNETAERRHEMEEDFSWRLW